MDYSRYNCRLSNRMTQLTKCKTETSKMMSLVAVCFPVCKLYRHIFFKLKFQIKICVKDLTYCQSIIYPYGKVDPLSELTFYTC